METLTPPAPETKPTRNRLWMNARRLGLFNWIVVVCCLAASAAGVVSCLGRPERSNGASSPVIESSTVVNNAYYQAAASTAQALDIARSTVVRALSGQPEPAVGLYWTSNADPTAGGGVCGAPLWQLLWRTDVPSIYYKSGSSCTAWTRVGNGASPGTGTVTSITAGTGLTATPNPITTSGTMSLNINGGVTQTCGAGTAVTALSGVGLTTCTAVGSGTVGPGTVGTYPVFTAATTIGNSTFPISESSATALSIGDSQSSDVTTLSGRMVSTSTNGANTALLATWTPAGGATTGLAAVSGRTTGTFDTTSGTIIDYGVFAETVATRSAGASNLSNIALFANATGGQFNTALRTSNGDVLLNNTSGVATLGFSNATANAVTIKGQSTQTSTLSTGNAAAITWTPAGGTTGNLGALALTSNGTIDTTAGALTSRGLSVTNTTARSAGANTLTNVAGMFTSTGAQTNVALRTVDGSNYFNDTSGNTGVGYAIGATIPQKFAVNGTSEIVGNLTLDAVLVGATASSAEVRGDVAASATVPTLIPNQASTTSGVGADAAGDVSLIASATEVLRGNSAAVSLLTTMNCQNPNGCRLSAAAASATSPTLIPNRTDVTTGIGADASGDVSVITAGTERMRFKNAGGVTTLTGISASAASGFALLNSNASGTVPTLIPNETDTTTGIGAQAAGNLSLIAGATEAVRVSSATVISIIPHVFDNYVSLSQGAGRLRDQRTAPTLSAGCGTGATVTAGWSYFSVTTNATAIGTCTITLNSIAANATSCDCEDRAASPATKPSRTCPGAGGNTVVLGPTGLIGGDTYDCWVVDH